MLALDEPLEVFPARSSIRASFALASLLAALPGNNDCPHNKGENNV